MDAEVEGNISMKLLIITQIVDSEDPILGFFTRWIDELARRTDKVIVICLKRGLYDVPKNVRVYSLGKEQGNASRVTYAGRFLRYIWKLRHEYDTVFVHMNPEYLVLGGWLWRLRGIRSTLWYTHKNVDLKLRMGTFFANVVCTASAESFRLPTKKVRVMGHGIGLGRPVHAKDTQSSRPVRIISIGRIAPAKQVELLLAVFSALRNRNVPFTASLVGGPGSDADRAYAQAMEKKAREIDIFYSGPLNHEEALQKLNEADIFLSASMTGSLDKAVLEAAAASVVPVFTGQVYSEAFQLPELCVSEDPERFADIVERLIKDSSLRKTYAEQCRVQVERNHSLTQLIPRLVTVLGD